MLPKDFCSYYSPHLMYSLPLFSIHIQYIHQWTVETPTSLIGLPWASLPIILFLWKASSHSLTVSFLYQLSYVITLTLLYIWHSFKIFWINSFVHNHMFRIPTKYQNLNYRFCLKVKQRREKRNLSLDPWYIIDYLNPLDFLESPESITNIPSWFRAIFFKKRVYKVNTQIIL